ISGPTVMDWLSGIRALAPATELALRVVLTGASATGRPPSGVSTRAMRSTAPTSRTATAPKASLAMGTRRREVARACVPRARLRFSGALRSLTAHPVNQTGRRIGRPVWEIVTTRTGNRLLTDRLGREGRVCFLTGEQPDRVLELVVLLLVGRHVDGGANGGRLLGATPDLSLESGLADDLVAALELIGHVLGDGDVRVDARGLDRSVVGRVIARRGQSHGSVRAKRDDRLHRSLAEGARAHEGCALVVLQGAGDDL